MAENGVRFVPGDWNAVCDICAQKYKSSQMKKRWDGLMVCPNDWEPRHPQDFLRAVPDRQAVPWSRPETPDVFVPFEWDQYINETYRVLEAIDYFSTYVRYIPFADVLQQSPPINRALNDQVLNWGVLGGADPAVPNTMETVFVGNETLVINATTNVADTVTMSESLMSLLGTGLFDTANVDEDLQFIPYFEFNAVLNGSALNTGPL